MIKSLVNNQQKLFWVLHLGGWLGWGLVAKYGYTRALSEEMVPNYFLYVMIISFVGMVYSLGLRYLYRLMWSRPIWQQAITLLLGSAAVGFAFIRTRGFIYTTWFEKAKDMEAWVEKMGDAAEMYQKFYFMESFTIGWLPILAWSILYFVIKYYQIFQEVQKSALKSAAMAHEAQLKMLRYQLNPHFLFNTLNAISTLILEKQTELANQMVTRLSSFLRYSLDNDPCRKSRWIRK